MAWRRLASAFGLISSRKSSLQRKHFSAAAAFRPPLPSSPAFASKNVFLFVRHSTDGAVTQSVYCPFKSVRLGKQKGHLWRTRKTLSREAQLAVGELVRHKDDPDRIDKAFKTSIARLLKLDLFGVLKELQREQEGVLALRMFHVIKKEEWYKPDILQYSAMLGCLAKTQLTEEAEKLFEEMKEDGLEPELNTYTELLRSLIFSKQVDKVHQIVREMKAMGCPPDLIVYKVLWVGLNAIGRPTDATIYKDELTEAQTRRQKEPPKELDEVDM